VQPVLNSHIPTTVKKNMKPIFPILSHAKRWSIVAPFHRVVRLGSWCLPVCALLLELVQVWKWRKGNKMNGTASKNQSMMMMESRNLTVCVSVRGEQLFWKMKNKKSSLSVLSLMAPVIDGWISFQDTGNHFEWN
jgi:hypothetical protein